MEQSNYSVKEYLLYKLDRTLALVGIILVAIYACSGGHNELANVALGGLIGYVGGRTNK